MDNSSILDQIIDSQKAEEVARLNAVEIVGNLFKTLSDRERDVLSRRFGLQKSEKETLEAVGQAHGLTRERIRQIESTTVKKLRQHDELREYVEILKNVISQILEEHGGATEKEYLFNLLTNFSVSSNGGKDEVVHQNNLDFLISKLLFDEFEEVKSSKHFKDAYKLKFHELDHLEELAEELLAEIREFKRVLKTEEIIDLMHKLKSYEKHAEKLTTKNMIDVSAVLGGRHFDEPETLINEKKAFYSLIKLMKKVEKNKFGHWGAHDSLEIRPKTINDKIYLVLKQNGKPMHFVEISEKINEVAFDKKSANPATVHNELILDEKYVLVGRGLYSLKEWGYKKGTVVDVIMEILSESENPLKRDDIIEKVLEKRAVKKNTVILALMDKEKFKKDENGGYVIIVKQVDNQ